MLNDTIDFLHDLHVEMLAYQESLPCCDDSFDEMVNTVHEKLTNLRKLANCAGCNQPMAANDSCANCMDHLDYSPSSGPVGEPAVEANVIHVSTASGEPKTVNAAAMPNIDYVTPTSIG